MPERPPAFDFKALKPNVPIEFTLLKESFSGRKEGADYDWHAYLCGYAGNEVMVFTPSERVHAALQYLKVLPNTKFTITKGTDLNIKTGKSFIYYEVKYGDQTVDTKNELTNGTPEAPGDPWADTSPIKEPKNDNMVRAFEHYYPKIFAVKFNNLHQFIKWEELDNVEKLQVLVGLDASTSANVSTILIQNGKQ